MCKSRDSLARAIFIIDNRLASNPARVWDEADSDTRYYAYAIADGLIEAGYGSQHDAWDDGVIYGHNTEGRLIDKRYENPYPKTEGAS